MSDEENSNASTQKMKRGPQQLTTLFPLLLNPFDLVQQSMDYWVDSFQRHILFIDVLRQRSNDHLSYNKGPLPNVLHFKFEPLLDGRNFTHPVNYMLFKIVAPEGVVTDPTKRPFIVFDPRAGHGPGIGGMKQDSEIGNTLRAGHPCYFVGFTPNPIPGQTIEQVCEAEAIFVAKVIEMHPQAEKPCLIGNCQAGWQIAMMGAVYPELVGVLILPGAPMSFWGGIHGKYPMRYGAGMNGGSWVVALASDLGKGKFDGAALVENFEKNNPANTNWKKAYNLYAKIDTETQRFLEFERWWGSPILLNGKEIQFIVDQLFVGNNLSNAKIMSSDGLRVDLRNIKSPILVFCSQGDDITPPQQALSWILDLYQTDKEIIATGQTIVYCMHKSIGHLGIFVASSVATKEHEKFVQNIDLIETLPPGLYEAVFIPKTKETAHADLASGDYVLRFESRKLEDIRAIGGNTLEDDRAFAAVSRMSENICGLYKTFVSPIVKSMVTENSAEMMRQSHPIRVRYSMYSDRNPLISGLAKMAEVVKLYRAPVPKDNIFWQMQEMVSTEIVGAWNMYRDLRDTMTEIGFFTFYGSPLVQASLGLQSSSKYGRRRAGRSVDRERGIQQRIHSLATLATVGGMPEALVRAMLYVVRGGHGFDEREFNMMREIINESKILPYMTQAEYKALVRQQHSLLNLDEKASMEAISKLLDSVPENTEREALETIRKVIWADGELTLEEQRRLKELERYFMSNHTSFHRRASDVQIFSEQATQGE